MERITCSFLNILLALYSGMKDYVGAPITYFEYQTGLGLIYCARSMSTMVLTAILGLIYIACVTWRQVFGALTIAFYSIQDMSHEIFLFVNFGAGRQKKFFHNY